MRITTNCLNNRLGQNIITGIRLDMQPVPACERVLSYAVHAFLFGLLRQLFHTGIIRQVLTFVVLVY